MNTLKDLLNELSTHNLRVVAGENGLTRHISTVTLLDAPDGPDWLKGGEFILTSAYIFDHNYDKLKDYILALVNKKAVGLGIKTGRFIDLISDEIIEIASQNQFPIIQIPYELVWTDIISPFYKLKYGSSDNDKLIIVKPDMILPLFEASRWGGKRLLTELTELFQLPAAIYRGDKALVLSNGLLGEEHFKIAINKLNTMPAIRHPEIVDINNYTFGCFCLPISYENKIEYLAIISEIRENILEIDRLVKLIERLTTKDNMLVGSRKKSDAYMSFMHKVITGSITPEEIKSFEKNRGEDDDYLTGMIFFESDKYLQLFQKFKETVGLYSISESVKAELFLYENPVGNQGIVLWEIKTDESLNFYVYMKGICNTFDTVYSEKDKNYHIGISKLSKSLSNIVQLYEQAQEVLHIGQILWPDEHWCFYDDYEIYVLLNSMDLSSVNIDQFNLLMASKSTMSFAPIETMEAFIECGNYKKAAAKLFLHENTLRYRINKINELLNINLDNPITKHQILMKIKLWKLHINKKHG